MGWCIVSLGIRGHIKTGNEMDYGDSGGTTVNYKGKKITKTGKEMDYGESGGGRVNYVGKEIAAFTATCKS